jgi:hypothetical protein
MTTATATNLRAREQNALTVVRNSGLALINARTMLRRTPVLGSEAIYNAMNHIVGRCPDGCCGGAEAYETFAEWVDALEDKAAKLVLEEMPEVDQRRALRTPTRDEEYRLQIDWELLADAAYSEFRDTEDARYDRALERAAESYAGPIRRDSGEHEPLGYDYEERAFHRHADGVYSEEASTLQFNQVLPQLRVRMRNSVAVFTLTKTRRDREHEVECWEYRSGATKLIIWND